MRTTIHEQAVALLLDSISKDSEEGLRASFFFGPPGSPHWQHRLGIEICYHPTKLTRAVLFIRQQGPAYLKYLPIDDIQSKLQEFVRNNFDYLANDVMLHKFTESFAAQVSLPAKAKFAEALAASEIFQPRDELTLFPLVPVRVTDDFDSGPFFLIAPQSLAARIPSGINPAYIVPDCFPPLADTKIRKERPGAWLGIRSPTMGASNKMKAAILGALALTPLPPYRYMFSERAMFGGYCTLADAATMSFRQDAHTPPLMHDIVVTCEDHAWLAQLASKLAANERSVRRQLRALEYFFRAWESEPPERFPVLCMALDGVFGHANHATQAVIDGIRGVLGAHIREPRLRQLMELRASVIHGGAPDVYDSRKYGRYYDEFEADPIHDLELIVASCLRAHVFNGLLKEHTDPNAAIIAEARAKGRFPRKLTGNTILDDDPMAHES